MQVAAMQSLARPLAARPVVASRATRTVRARSAMIVRAENAWYPGASKASYLEGLAGNRGFDPLRLCENPDTRRWLVAAEKYNGRWAMMGVAGILFVDLLGIDWVKAAAPAEAPLGGIVPFALIHLLSVGVFEIFRWNDWKKGGKMDGIGPINPFDPLGMTSPETEEKEIKNARLAMTAFLGFMSQYAVRGLGPIECLKLHLDNPGYNNIFTSSVGNEATVAVVALAILPMVLQARKQLNGGKEEAFRPIPFDF